MPHQIGLSTLSYFCSQQKAWSSRRHGFTDDFSWCTPVLLLTWASASQWHAVYPKAASGLHFGGRYLQLPTESAVKAFLGGDNENLNARLLTNHYSSSTFVLLRETWNTKYKSITEYSTTEAWGPKDNTCS